MINEQYFTAIAAASGVTEARAAELFSLSKPAKRIKARAEAVLDAVEATGAELHEVDMAECIAQYPKAHRDLDGITLNHPARMHKFWKDGNNYLFFNAKGESWAVVDGVLQGGFQRSCKVTQVWRIVPKAVEQDAS